MAKKHIAYVCSDCGSEYGKWQGKCDDCGAWNTIKKFVVSAPSKTNSEKLSGYTGTTGEIHKLNQIKVESLSRIITGISELDRVLGGGLVPGSVILIGGQPGAGKSTLLLQILCQLAKSHNSLYVTGEESLQQIAVRANRLQLPTDELNIVSQTDIDKICTDAQSTAPVILVIDSIQVMQSADLSASPGSVSQVRECAAILTRYAKLTNTIILMIGHVTKDGMLAGPKVLEHMIDCSIMLEGDDHSRYRTLRSTKNRYGAVNELGVFAMTALGLKEVKNPSAIFLSRSKEESSGSVVLVIWEGSRPMLVELQALVDQNNYGNPQRLAVGVEGNRLTMLLAILHKHGGISISDQDVFVNIVGGIKIAETSSDLALLIAVTSSFRETVLGKDLVVFGEVGLSGEIRPVPNGLERIKEAQKHGFKRAIIPKENMPKAPIDGIELIGVARLQEALDRI